MKPYLKIRCIFQSPSFLVSIPSISGVFYEKPRISTRGLCFIKRPKRTLRNPENSQTLGQILAPFEEDLEHAPRNGKYFFLAQIYYLYGIYLGVMNATKILDVYLQWNAESVKNTVNTTNYLG